MPGRGSACCAPRSRIRTSRPACARACARRSRAGGLGRRRRDAARARDADDALGPIILYEAYAEHRERLERRGRGLRPRHAHAARDGRRVSEPPTARRWPPASAFKAALARAFAGVDVLAGPTVAYTAPPEDPPVGTPEGDVEGRFTGPWNLAGVPAVSMPCGIAEGGAACRAAARRRRRRRRAAAVRGPRIRKAPDMRIATATGSRSRSTCRATTGSCCRSARSSSTPTCRSGST